MIKDFVYFVDKEGNSSHGLLLADDNIICLDCGGIIEPDDYTILEYYGTERIHYINDLLKEHF